MILRPFSPSWICFLRVQDELLSLLFICSFPFRLLIFHFVKESPSSGCSSQKEDSKMSLSVNELSEDRRAQVSFCIFSVCQHVPLGFLNIWAGHWRLCIIQSMDFEALWIDYWINICIWTYCFGNMFYIVLLLCLFISFVCIVVFIWTLVSVIKVIIIICERAAPISHLPQNNHICWKIK